MNKEKMERKLKIENLERCMNCRLLIHCSLIKDDVVCCSKYQEVDEEKQVVVVGFEQYYRVTAAYDHR